MAQPSVVSGSDPDTLSTPDSDCRIVKQTSFYRAVAPGLVVKGGSRYINSTNLIFEKKSKDAMGADIWVEVHRLSANSTGTDEIFYRLLLGY